jgi:hypothetical protein
MAEAVRFDKPLDGGLTQPDRLRRCRCSAPSRNQSAAKSSARSTIHTSDYRRVVRFLLGAAEAGFFPGIILFPTYWFSSQYRGADSRPLHGGDPDFDGYRGPAVAGRHGRAAIACSSLRPAFFATPRLRMVS